MLVLATLSASVVVRLLRMKMNTRPAITPKATSTAATEIPAVAPVLSPDDESCDTLAVMVAGTAPAAPFVPEVEIDKDAGNEEVDVEGVLVVELVAADMVPGKSSGVIAGDFMLARGF